MPFSSTLFVTSGSPPHTWGKYHRAGSIPRRWSVHPHIRGENVLRVHALQNRVRFTPTYVGKMPSDFARTTETPVHPHIRGENDTRRRILYALDGSPPHTWGKCFTPPTVANVQAVHPHIRGENGRQDAEKRDGSRFTPTYVGKITKRNRASWARCGSPPHTWGKLGANLSACIPKAVHPHIRGENAVHGHGVDRAVRFTPTYVGKMHDVPFQTVQKEVHPHIRGENSCDHGPCCSPGRFTPTYVGKMARAVPPSVMATGSPPHTWGKSAHTVDLKLAQRFTPTYVGKI